MTSGIYISQGHSLNCEVVHYDHTRDFSKSGSYSGWWSGPFWSQWRFIIIWIIVWMMKWPNMITIGIYHSLVHCLNDEVAQYDHIRVLSLSWSLSWWWSGAIWSHLGYIRVWIIVLMMKLPYMITTEIYHSLDHSMNDEVTHWSGWWFGPIWSNQEFIIVWIIVWMMKWTNMIIPGIYHSLDHSLND